jgi:hypothetical protein
MWSDVINECGEAVYSGLGLKEGLEGGSEGKEEGVFLRGAS